MGACLLAGVAAVPAVAADAVRVTMIIYSAPGDPFWNPVIHGAQEAAKDRGVSLDIQYGDQDPVKQNNLIQTAIANKVDGLAVVNWTPDAFTASIAAARKAGIGVVVFDTDDPRPNATASQGYVGQNFFTAGQNIARYMVAAAGLKKGDHVVCPVEDPDAFYGVERYRGIKSVLDEAGIASEKIDATPTMATALTRVAEYLVGHQDTKAVIGLGSVVTEVAPQAVADARLKVAVGGFDLSPQIIDDIIVGKTLATTGLRTQTGALVLAVGRGRDEIPTPGPQFRLAADDVLVVVGQPAQLRAAARLVAGTTAAAAPR